MRRSRPRWSSHNTGQPLMPIHARYRWFYPIDWPQLSAVIRFRRAQGKCEGCGRPHGRTVCHLGDGRWWDREKRQWRDGRGKPIRQLPALWLWKGTIRFVEAGENTPRLAAQADSRVVINGLAVSDQPMNALRLNR